jgi:hypothetical protein
MSYRSAAISHRDKAPESYKFLSATAHDKINALL